MKKYIVIIICLLGMFRNVYSQPRTIQTTAQLVKKLNKECNVANPKNSAIYYAEFVIQGDSILIADYRNITDTTLRQTLENCIKKNGSNISWQSILGTGCNSSKTFNVLLPFIIMSDYNREKSGSDCTLSEVYEKFFSQSYLNASIAFLLPAIHMEVSRFECGPLTSN